MNETFTLIIERFGISFTFLMAFVWCLYKSGIWLGEKVVIPLQKRHLQFLDKLEDGIDGVVKTQATTLEILNQILMNTKELPALKRSSKTSETLHAE